jgi:serine/threonine protein kinase
VADLSIGSVIGGYRIDGIIGQGGMGVVYRATQLGLDRTVAVKVIMPGLAQDAGFRERFGREARLAASIDHNNVVPVYEAGEVDGLLYLAMRFVDGQDLSKLLANGPLEPARAAAITRQVASALDAAHKRGLVHRDVKPGNILIVGEPGEEHAYLTDFGLTKQISAEQGLTKTGEWVGTIDYAAPEQIDGRPMDARTDVYALGCVFYQALTGAVPYVRETDVAKMYAHLHDPPRLVSESVAVPAELDAVVQRAMAKDPEDRFPSAGDLGKAAVAAAAGQQRSTPEVSVAVGAAAPGPAPPTHVSGPEPPEPTVPATDISPQPTPVPPSVPTVEQPPPAATPPPQQQPVTPPQQPLVPEPAAAAPPQQPLVSQPAAAPPPQPPHAQPAPPPGGKGRGGWIAAGIVLVLIAGGVGAAAGGVFSKDDNPGSTTISDTTATPAPTEGGEPTGTATADGTDTPAPTPTEESKPPPGLCRNRFISSRERAQLSDAMRTNESALKGSVFYGVCGGDTWALATFPDGRNGAFIRRNGRWERFGSIAQGICQIPSELLVQWKMSC